MNRRRRETLGERTESGFTLVELICIFVIIAIMAAFGFPSLMGYLDKGRDNEAINDAHAVVAAAQSLETSKYLAGSDVTLADADQILQLADSKGSLHQIHVYVGSVAYLVYETKDHITVTYCKDYKSVADLDDEYTIGTTDHYVEVASPTASARPTRKPLSETRKPASTTPTPTAGIPEVVTTPEPDSGFFAPATGVTRPDNISLDQWNNILKFFGEDWEQYQSEDVPKTIYIKLYQVGDTYYALAIANESSLGSSSTKELVVNLFDGQKDASGNTIHISKENVYYTNDGKVSEGVQTNIASYVGLEGKFEFTYDYASKTFTNVVFKPS